MPSPLWREILARDRGTKPGSPAKAGDLALLGRNLVKQGKGSEAESLLRECLAIRTKLSRDEWLRFNTMGLLGGLAAQGSTPRPSRWWSGATKGSRPARAKIPAAGRFNLAEGAERVVRLFEAWGRPESGVKSWAQKLGLADLPEDVFARP